MSLITQLLIIDPQNDFCDLPTSWCPTCPVSGKHTAPTLPVTGAHGDMLRLATFINAAHAGIDAITVTLDSHNRFDIAHPTFWKAGDGAGVAPFTQITAEQVRRGAFLPRDNADLPQALAYLDELERRGRYTLMVWPVHCEIGTWGHNIHAAVRDACAAWADDRLEVVHMVNKGSNPWTEHYSAIQAEVPDAQDPDTQLNARLIARLDQAEVLIIAGEASSHCVKATTEHIVANMPSQKPSKIVLLTDCMSPVTGFEPEQQAFLTSMAALGVSLSNSIAYLDLAPTAA